MDEAHHLKNPGTSLARHFKAADIDPDHDSLEDAVLPLVSCAPFLERG
jgi:hypothetical protein